MRAQGYMRTTGVWSSRDVPAQNSGRGHLLVEIENAGFCHSDIHVIYGEIRVLPRMPLTLRHANAGRVSIKSANRFPRTRSWRSLSRKGRGQARRFRRR